MGKKNKCISTPRGIKSKDQGGGEKSKVVQPFTPLFSHHYTPAQIISRIHAFSHPHSLMIISLGRKKLNTLHLNFHLTASPTNVLLQRSYHTTKSITPQLECAAPVGNLASIVRTSGGVDSWTPESPPAPMCVLAADDKSSSI